MKKTITIFLILLNGGIVFGESLNNQLKAIIQEEVLKGLAIGVIKMEK